MGSVFAKAWQRDSVIDIDASHPMFSQLPGSSIGREEVKFHIVCQDPQVLLVPNFLTDDEIEELLKLCGGQWKPSQLNVSSSYHEGAQKSRTNSSPSSPYSVVMDWEKTKSLPLEGRLAKLANMGVHHLESLNGVRYEPGLNLPVHHDGPDRPVTILMYLNDLEDGDGGQTRFPNLGLQFIPRKGAAVVWHNLGPDGQIDSRLAHQALPTKKGIKYAVNCWFNELPLRQTRDEMLADDMHEWIVTVNKGNDESIGIKFHEIQNALVIDLIKKGLLADWNSRNSDLAVRPGDFIVSVNGSCGSPERICSACQTIGMLKICMRRHK